MTVSLKATYKLYTPVPYRSSTNVLALHGDACLHIVQPHARRDPVTDRGQNDDRNIVSLDVFTQGGAVLHIYTLHAKVDTTMSPLSLAAHAFPAQKWYTKPGYCGRWVTSLH